MLTRTRAMATCWISALLLTISACGGGGGQSAPIGDVTADEAGEPGDAFAADVTALPDTAFDSRSDTAVAPDETGEPDTATPPDLVVPAGPCSQTAFAECAAEEPAPSTAPGIQAFAVNNAIRLRCPEAGGAWDFTVLLEDFTDQRLFFFGEIHGSNEIGPASADLFETLVRHAGVNVLALEIGMDTTQALNEYVQTGSAAAADEIGMDMYGDNMFRRTLPDRARELVLEGYDIYVVGVDVPQRLAWVNEQVEALAQGMDSAAAKGLVLDTMPPPREMNSYGMMGLEWAYVEKAQAWYDHIVESLPQICPHLEAADCERLEYLAYALYMGAVFVSQDFAMGAIGGGDQSQLMTMMMERENIIIWNFQMAMASPESRCYSHMGAAHTSKGGWNVAGQLDKFFGPLKDRVYSTTPAYGPGSAVFYGYMARQVGAEPTVIGESMAGLPEENYYLSTWRPGLDCTANPLFDQTAAQVGAAYGSAYDSFFWFRQLTAENPGGWFYVPVTPRQRFFARQLERLQRANELLARAQRLYQGD